MPEHCDELAANEKREGEGEGGRGREREGGREFGWVMGWGAGNLLSAMDVAANPWSADGKETRRTVLYLQRERGRAKRKKERERESERERERERERKRERGT